MSIGEDLRTFLTTDAGVLAIIPDATDAGKVQQNKIVQGTEPPFIYYQRSVEETVKATDGSNLTKESRFDIECISNDVDEALDLAEAVKSALDGHQGAIGNSHAQATFVADHTDDYIPKTNAADSGLHFAAIDVRIIVAA